MFAALIDAGAHPAMLRILFFALVIGLGIRAVRALFSPPTQTPGPRSQGGGRQRDGAPDAPGPHSPGPTIKDVPDTDYRWKGQDDGTKQS